MKAFELVRKRKARLSPYYLTGASLDGLTSVLNSLMPAHKRLAWVSSSQASWVPLMQFGTYEKSVF